MFGAPKTFGIGQPSAFGQSNTSLFSQTPATAGQQPQQSLFGNSSSSLFGGGLAAAAPTTSAFGGFSTPTNTNTTGGLFKPAGGFNAPTFGAAPTSTAPAFGGGFGFGAAKPTTFSGFGGNTTPAQSTSLFGQPANPGGMGGTTFGGSTFGSPSTSAFAQSGATGTAVAKYQPHSGTDTLMKNGQTNSVSTRLHCITAMKEYEAKSLEELRLEDYLANRKGPQAGAVAPSTGFFGASPPQTTGLFGAQVSQPQTTGLFGQSPPTNTIGGFNQPNTGMLFGAQAPAANTQQPTSLFGNTAAPVFGGGLANQSAFGQQQQPAAANNNLFGAKPFGAASTTANTGFTGFGTNTTAAKPFGTSLFGQPAAPPTSSAFNTQMPSNAFTGFGTQPQTAPGQQPTSLFGNTGGSMFGGGGLTSTAPAFGTATNTTTGGLFKPTTGFNTSFGATPASTAPAFTGFNANPSGFGTFGQQSTLKQAPMTGFTGFGTQQNTSTFNSGLQLGGTFSGFGTQSTQMQQPQQAAVPIHQQILSMATSPYGDNPIFKDLKPLNSLNEDALRPTNPAAQKAILEASSNNFKVSPKVGGVGLKLKPVGSTVSKKSLFGGLEEFDSSVDESFSLKPNAKRLVIKPKAPSAHQNLANRSLQSTQSSNLRSSLPNDGSRLSQPPIASLPESEMTRRISWLHSNLDKVSDQNRNTGAPINDTMQDLVSGSKSVRGNPIGADFNRNDDHSKSRNSTSDDSLLRGKSCLNESASELPPINTDPHPTGITLTRPGYYIIPSLDKLTDYIGDDGSCIVPDFTIGRKGYGNVYFSGPIDIAGLNLDELVHFRHKEVIIYPDDENKPPIGQGLNRKAQITLDQVWPHDKTRHEPIKDRERLDEMNYEGKLRAVCDKHDTRFVEYRPDTGSWVFKVDHFSKYGLDDSDEEDDFDAANKAKAKPMQLNGAQPVQAAISKKIFRRTPEESTSRVAKEQPFGGVTIDLDNDFEDSNSLDSDMNGNRFPTPISPSTEIAMSMNSNPHKLQLMKASLFVDDDYDNKSVISDRYGGRDSPEQIVPSKKQFTFSFSSHSVMSKGASSPSSIDTPALSPTYPPRRDIELTRKCIVMPEESLLQSSALKSAPLILRPKVAIVRASESNVDLVDSVLVTTLGQNIVADTALYHGRRFNVGWAHSNQFTILTGPNNADADLYNGRTQSRAVIKRMKLCSLEKTDSENFRRSILGHLECRLNYIEKKFNTSSDCPYFEVKGGADALKEHYDVAMKYSQFNEFDKLCATVWSLCMALWGEQEDLENINGDDHIAIMLRRDLFSKWLENVVAEKSLLESNINDDEYLTHLWKLLTTHRIQEACELAFEKNDINLSMLLAQVGSSNVVRAMISMQLESWRVTEADQFIAADRLKAMMLVGAISTLETSNGVLNIYEKLDWLKSIALTLWYMCSPTASITDAVIKYDESTESLAEQPSPPYQNRYDILTRNSAEPIQDIRYHILKLYSRRSHPMEQVLNPATHSPDIMDFRLSWNLLQVLKGIGYSHCSTQSDTHLCVSFASQLENYGLWQWSIFVLLHIQDQNKRELSVQELLYRYVDLSQNIEYRSKENFIVNVLNVPEKWINWAKAVRAGAMNKHHAQADYLLLAKQWPLAHEVIMDHIAPDAIINGNSQYLKELLDRFEDPRHVPNWSNQGAILLDYLDITAKFETLKMVHERDIETRWEGLKPQLSELCSRINLFPCPTAKHRLCQSEIAQGLAILVNGMEILCNEINPCLMLKKTLEKLPLPEEFAKQKIRTLLENNSLIDMMQTE